MPFIISISGPAQSPPTRSALERAFRAAGEKALEVIREAYLAKSRGGTDESGLWWAPLSATTIARRERKKQGARKALLASGLLKLWHAVFAEALAAFRRQGLPDTVARGTAARRAWAAVRGKGGVTADRRSRIEMPVLIDTGLLFTALMPGKTGNILEVGPSSVTVGVRGDVVPYAMNHHRGVLGRMPARPLWRDFEHWPPAWKRRVLDAVRHELPGATVEEWQG